MVSTWTTKKLKGEVTDQTDAMVDEMVDEMKRNWGVENIATTIPQQFRYIARVPRSNHRRYERPRRAEDDPTRWSYGVLRKLRKLTRCSKGDVAGGLASLQLMVEKMETARDRTGLLGLWPRNLKPAITHYKHFHPGAVNNWARVRSEDLRQVEAILGETLGPSACVMVALGPAPTGPTAPIEDSDSESEDEDDENDDEDDDEDDDDDRPDGAHTTTTTLPIRGNTHATDLGEQHAENGTATTGTLMGSGTIAQDPLTDPNTPSDAADLAARNAREESSLFIPEATPEPANMDQPHTTEPLTAKDTADPTCIRAQREALLATIQNQNGGSLFGDGPGTSTNTALNMQPTTTESQTLHDHANPLSQATGDSAPPPESDIDIKPEPADEVDVKIEPGIKIEPGLTSSFRRKRPGYYEFFEDDPEDKELLRLRIDVEEKEARAARTRFEAMARERKRQRKGRPGGWLNPLVID
ncbi:hypothetical protein BU16DRAFT_44646 [Lophium mytilinum]|uniref:Uncharacterized protein n=1 Tax=Lophium mytilinum TaxID=390894 RepID=A0A6A6QQ86_9PEZI|nr:hypothetical protein BU16DRAFT_44646 [Lophium mytilinum]